MVDTQQQIEAILARYGEDALIDWSTGDEGISQVVVVPFCGEACGFSVAWGRGDIIFSFTEIAYLELDNDADGIRLAELVRSVAAGNVVQEGDGRSAAFRVQVQSSATPGVGHEMLIGVRRSIRRRVGDSKRFQSYNRPSQSGIDRS